MEGTQCPFCGNTIENNAEKCSQCGALFREPDLPNLKFKEFRTFLAIDILTFGFFASVWFFLNYNAINDLATKVKDTFKLKWLVILLGISLFVYIFYFNTLLSIFFMFAQYAILTGLTYRVLKIIQRYTEKKYDVVLEFNPYYIVFFSVLYLIHFIDTYSDRVKEVHDHFDFRSPQGIALIIVLIIIAAFVNCWPYLTGHLYF